MIDGKLEDLAKGALILNSTMVLLAICCFIAGFAISKLAKCPKCGELVVTA